MQLQLLFRKINISLEAIISYLQQLSPFWVYAAIFFIAYIENLFPPSPSDVMIVAGGYLVGIGHIDFISALVIATIGSTTGFMTMYKIGDWFGLKIIETRKIKFLPLDSVHKVEIWFRHYGYWLIIANRFLSGTRAVVGFFAGMAEVKFVPTAILCFVSALIWNWILVYAGTLLGENWKAIGDYLSTYSQIVAVLVFIGSGFIFVVWYRRRGKKND
ncbi:MAG: DedA family protein [Bacteroidota bacterium]|jgi:membrane protein DedA with SNARE-associated domain